MGLKADWKHQGHLDTMFPGHYSGSRSGGPRAILTRSVSEGAPAEGQGPPPESSLTLRVSMMAVAVALCATLE